MSDSLTYLDLDRWQELVEACPTSLAFHHRNWLELFVEQYGCKALIPAIERDGEIAAAVPFLAIRGMTGKRKLVSLPYSDCVPVLPFAEEPVDALFRTIRAELGPQYTEIVIRSERPLPMAICDSNQVRHVLRTDRTYEQLRAGYPKTLVRVLKSFGKQDMNVQWRTDSEAMDVFYNLQVKTRHKLGVPVQPRQYFRRLHRHMIAAGLGCVGIASLDGRPLASAVLLTYKRSVIYKYGASEPSMLHCHPNDIMFDHALRRACEGNFDTFDFGLSAKSQAGLRRFKSKWGAEESELYHAYLEGEPVPRVEQSRTFKVVSFAIRHSPPAVCRCLGEALYRFSQ